MLIPGPRRRLGAAGRTVLKELGAFGVVGTSCFFLDLLVFQVLYAAVGTGPVLAKLLSTVVSSTVAYVAHRYWSFSHRERSTVRREYLVFALVNGGTLLLSLAAVGFAHGTLHERDALVLQLVNVVSILVGTVIRFLAYRQWVFRAARPAAPPTVPRESEPVAPEPDRACDVGLL